MAVLVVVLCVGLCVDKMVVSSAYATVVMFGDGVGRSAVYMLKSVGESTPPNQKFSWDH